jgi:hypothetical protein
MPTLEVAKPFMVKLDPTLPDGQPRDPTELLTYVFPTPGIYDMNDEVAQHWFTQPHLAGYVEPTPSQVLGLEVMHPEPPPEGGVQQGLADAVSRGAYTQTPDAMRLPTLPAGPQKPSPDDYAVNALGFEPSTVEGTGEPDPAQKPTGKPARGGPAGAPIAGAVPGATASFGQHETKAETTKREADAKREADRREADAKRDTKNG